MALITASLGCGVGALVKPGMWCHGNLACTNHLLVVQIAIGVGVKTVCVEFALSPITSIPLYVGWEGELFGQLYTCLHCTYVHTCPTEGCW